MGRVEGRVDGVTVPSVEGGGYDDAAYQRTMAAMILSVIYHKYPLCQTECVKQNAHVVCPKLLAMVESTTAKENNPSSSPMDPRQHRPAITENEHQLPPQFRLWICIFLRVLLRDHLNHHRRHGGGGTVPLKKVISHPRTRRCHRHRLRRRILPALSDGGEREGVVEESVRLSDLILNSKYNNSNFKLWI